MSAKPWTRLAHAQRRSIILPRQRILYVPMPKSGCTSMLWALAGAAGLASEQFHRSVSAQVTPSMTIHDLDRWRDKFKWAELSEQERLEIAADPAWLRFTTVRHPAPRLWSAWQSKLLLREPDYVTAFGPEAWFPRRPSDSEEVVEAFREFIRALELPADRRPSDAHWAPQSRVLDAAPPLTHIGRTESLDETVAVVRDHIGGRAASRVTISRENSGLLPYSPALYDDKTAEIVNHVYAEDLSEFGYAPLDPADATLDEWHRTAGFMLPLLRGHIERHERMTVLSRFARRSVRRKEPAYDPTDVAPASDEYEADYEGGVHTHAVP